MSVVSYADDKRMLWHVLVRLLGIDPGEVKVHLLSNALRANGVKTFTGDLLTMSPDDIMKLEAVRQRFQGVWLRAEIVPLVTRRKLVIAVACFHHYSRINGGNIDMRLVTQDMFDNFRTALYDPNNAIIPWKVKLPGEVNAEAEWKKNVKPARSDYKC